MYQEKVTIYGTQDEVRQNKHTTQYVLDTTTHKQTQDEEKHNKHTTQYVLDNSTCQHTQIT